MPPADSTHRDVEIDNLLLRVVGHVGRLHPDVGDVDGAGKEEEDSQARQQQAESHRDAHVEFPGV